MQPVDFKNLNLPTTPNYALAAYAAYAGYNGTAATPDFVVPSYHQPAPELAKHLVQVLTQMPRTHAVKTDNKNNEYTFIQKTRIFRFPDWIDVKVYPIDAHNSTFVMLSRSEYGHYDFGVNKKRIQNFLETLSSQQ